MANPGRARTVKEHAFAQALDLARRQAGLSNEQLAERLYVSARSVRRYQSAERRPARDVVEAWERACGVQDGRLVALWTGLDVPEAEGDGAAPAVSAGGPSRRGRAAIVAAFAIAVLVAILIAAAGDDDGPERAFTATTLAGDPIGAGWDHKDPAESGCARTAELLAAVPVMDGPRRAGTLELRGSTACQTGWPRVVLRRSHAAPFVLEIDRRSDGARDRYVFGKTARVVFGNMLKHDRSCVVASVRVGPPTASALRARTPCRR